MMNEVSTDPTITVPGLAGNAQLQCIYLDFDGEETIYRGEILSIDSVSVSGSGIDGGRAAEIAAALNAKYEKTGVRFVTKRPESGLYSTIFVGKTAAFDKYGNFTGLAETVDTGNRIKNDNAFVNLDFTATNAQLADVIGHEAEHLLGTLDHGGEGLAKFGYYDVYYTLYDKNYKYGYSDTIRNGNMTNLVEPYSYKHNLTYSVQNPSTGSYVFVKSYIFSPGSYGETVSHPQPSVKTILNALNISLDNGNIRYKDLYGKSFTIREKWYAANSRRLSDDYYCYDTLTIVPTGTLLLQASSLATGTGSTNYQNAIVKADQQTLAGLTVGNGGNGNLVVNSEDGYGQLIKTTITQNGRVEFDHGSIGQCTVENGGVVALCAYTDAKYTEINKGGTLYYDGKKNYGLVYTTVNAEGALNVIGGNVLNVTVNSQGGAALSSGISLNGDIGVEAGGCISIYGQLTKDDRFSCDLTLDVSNNRSTPTVMVDGFRYLPEGTTVTVNVSAKPEEGTYLLAGGVDSGKLPAEINFTVDGKTLTEKYEGQYTFVWDAKDNRYSTIDYNGLQYSLVLNDSATELSLAVTDEIPDWVLERLSRNMGASYSVYQDHKVGEILEIKNGSSKYYFKIVEIFKDGKTGFYAMGLQQINKNGSKQIPCNNSLLICRGTEVNVNPLNIKSDIYTGWRDIIADINPQGIGYDQRYSSGGNTAAAWLQAQKANGKNLYCSGHSLGGALAQYFAADIGEVEKLTTFNSPGINTDRFVDGTVHHYIVDGDIVSLAGAGYAYSDDSMVYFSTDRSSDYESITAYLGDRHTGVWTCNENGGNCDRVFSVADLSSNKYSYLTLGSFNTNFASIVLTLYGGVPAITDIENIPENVSKTIRLTTRNGVENFRKTATSSESVGIFYDSQAARKRYCRVFDTVLSSSVCDNSHTIKAIDIDNDNIPEVLYDFTDLKFLSIKSIYLQDSLLFSGSDFENNVQTVSIEKNDDQWVMFSIPDTAGNFYKLFAVMNSAGTKLNANNVFHQNGRYYVLDDPDTTYSFTFVRDESVSRTTGSLTLPDAAINSGTESLTITLSDIDASKNAGGGNDAAAVKVELYNNSTLEQTISLTAGETKMEGVFQATLNLNGLNITPNSRLVVSYSDSCDESGRAAVVSREIAATLNTYMVSIDENGLSADYEPLTGNAEWHMFAVSVSTDSLVGKYTIARNIGDYSDNVLVFDAVGGKAAELELGSYFSASGKACRVDNVGGDLVVTVEDADYKQNFNLAVAGKQPQNFFAAQLTPGVYTITGDFAAGMNATITVTDLATGKKIGSLAVKKGAIAKQSSFMLDGDCLFTIAGDGKTDGECSITLEGKVNNAADNSDDNIELARWYAGVNFLADSVGFGDSVDWILTDIDTAGRYDVTVSGIDAAAKVTVALWSSLNGGQAKKVASKTAAGKDIKLENLLLPSGDGMEYFVSVTCDNAGEGVFTDYTMSVTGAVYDSLYADTSDNALTLDAELLTLNGGDAVDAATGSYLKTASIDGWVGYGDPVDVMPFTVTTPGEWSIRLKADMAKSVTMKLQSVTVDPSSGAFKYTDIANGKADANGVISFSNLLQTGAYAITVTCNDQKTDKFNTAYSLTLNETKKFATLNTSGGGLFTMGKGETRTFTLTSVQKISLNKTSNLSLWTGNGKNGKTAVKFTYDKAAKTYDAMLAPGTYFLSAAKTVYDISVVGSYPDGYGSSMFTDNNTFLSASAFYGDEESFVGFGDGVDYYEFTVGDWYFAPGDYTLTLGDAVSNCVSVTAYAKVVSNGKISYKQLAKFTHKTGEKTSATLKDLIDGDYYIKVESLSYANPANAKETTYQLSLSSAGAYKELALGGSIDSASSALAKGKYACYQGTGDGDKVTVYKIDARIANGYEVYVNNGNGKLTKVETYNNTFILEDDRLFYVKSTKDVRDYSQGISLSVLSTIDPGKGFDGCFSAAGADNRRHLGSLEDGDFTDGWSGWIGYTQASDSVDFLVGEDGAVSAGWADLEISAIGKSLGDTSTVKFSLTLEKRENGTWKKIGSTTVQSAYDKKTASYKLSGKALGAALADNTEYRLTVATSDKGAGQSSGSFTVRAAVDLFDNTNDSLAAPTLLTADTEGTVVKKFDAFDVYDLADVDRFYLDMDSGSVKLTFYDDGYNAVALTGTYLTDKSGKQVGALKKASSVTLDAGSAKSDGFMMASSDLLEYGIRFAKLEANGNANNHYRIAIGKLI